MEVNSNGLAALMYEAAHGDGSVWSAQREHTRAIWTRAAQAAIVYCALRAGAMAEIKNALAPASDETASAEPIEVEAEETEETADLADPDIALEPAS